MGALPDHLTRNAIKRPNDPRYQKFGELRSREYAMLLALSMLDGSFDDSATASDPVYSQSNPNGGQHRYAAQVLLELSPEQSLRQVRAAARPTSR